jgi:hypothetical protein
VGYNEFEKLIGKKVISAHTDGGNLYLVLDNNKVIELYPEGDCCSHCYIQHVSGTPALIGGVIAKIEDIKSIATEEEKKNADVLEAWGHRFYIQGKGIFDIEMRLNHNGYYGGWVNVTELDTLPSQFVKVLEDF